MDVFFNELSIKEAEHPNVAKNWMSNLMNLYKITCTSGFKGFRISGQALQQNLAAGYTFHNWMIDRTADETARKLFLAEISKQPFIDEIIEQKNKDERRLCEFKYNTKEAKGLGAACLFDSLAISFDNDEDWDKSSIEIDVSSLSFDTTNIVEEKKEVKHGSKNGHITGLNNWILNKKKLAVTEGIVLWKRKKELFPYLIFCQNTRSQLYCLKECNPEFVQIKHILFALNEYCTSWVSGSFNPKVFPHEPNPESATREVQLRTQLTIVCPDGQTRFFSWHFKFTPGPGRIHFVFDESNRICYVGHIGRKID